MVVCVLLRLHLHRLVQASPKTWFAENSQVGSEKKPDIPFLQAQLHSDVSKPAFSPKIEAK